MNRGQRQLATEEANKARLITKTRWIIEARNGHLKNCFQIFKGVIPIQQVPHLKCYLRIACALINKYFDKINMAGADIEFAERMKQLAVAENVIKTRVEVERLHLRNIANDQWINLNELELQEFPRLTLQYLRDLTFGVYQLKLAPGYVQDKMQRENVDHFCYQVTQDENGLLRARIYSRFRQSTKHQLWISFTPTNEENLAGEPILGYYCLCKAGARTVGCCAHVASILWYLGYARHNENITYPSNQLLHRISDAADRELPPPNR